MGFSDKIARKLRAKLNGAHVRARESQGKTLSYIEGWHAISEANRIFGFDGWNRETVELRRLSETNGNNHPSDCAYLAKVRITVKAGDEAVIREGTGAGYAKGATLAEAHALAAKEAETDATKRALSTFGNPFGLALYDREQKGVRRPKAAAFKPRLWIVHDSDGAVSAQFTDARACAHMLRDQIVTAATLSELTSLWTANNALIEQLEKQLSRTARTSAGSATDNRSMTGDLDLTGAYQSRYAKLWTQRKIPQRQDDLSASTDGGADKSAPRHDRNVDPHENGANLRHIDSEATAAGDHSATPRDIKPGLHMSGGIDIDPPSLNDEDLAGKLASTDKS